MIIRCKRCFKKHDVSHGVCPRCSYDNYKIKKQSSPSNPNVETYTERLIHFFARFKKDYITNGSCQFCNTIIYNKNSGCNFCHAKYKPNLEVNQRSSKSASSQLLKNIANQQLKSNSTNLDLSTFKKELESNGFNLSAWNDQFEYQSGHVPDPRIFVPIYWAALFMFWSSYGWWINFYTALSFVFLLIIGSLLVFLFCINYRLQFIETFKDKLGYYKPGRYDNVHHELKVEDVKLLELVLNEEHLISNIVFHAKTNAKIEALVYSVNVDNFDKKEDIPHHFMLYCLKHGIKLSFSLLSANNDDNLNILEGNVENKETLQNTLYVRIDEKIRNKPLSNEEFEQHIKYLKNISEERYFMGGGFKKESGGMILFSAKNMDEAHSIAENDPIILNGAYRYDLKEWEVKFRSS